ncbi:MAG: hypothetical protein DIZ80_04345 [endosymbiont of Galathealinum brachiosum]|uniref:Uncharacterized protein n=1 Tax=endosymbiont of Galathealinum brachiosum TaxID=2200906 RepID=A0A370DIN5_9GAMM|nr:MAG: hypothetical protein DIZ80_04345 [endosymbiont of Galathealinum brachiosum]
MNSGEITRMIHQTRGKVAAFWHPVPCCDAIKSFTESDHHCQIMVVWVEGTERERCSVPEGDDPEH